jgi:uncharacterized membrane protein YkoI
MRTLTTIIGLTALCFSAALAQKKLAVKDLPPAVQKTVQEQLKGGEIKNISKETEGGVTQYEVESVLGSKHRDFNVDTKGNLVVMEEESSLEGIPAAAKAAILKKAGTGKLGMVEIVTKGSETLYEAAYTSKGGKKAEVMVKADGTEVKN